MEWAGEDLPRLSETKQLVVLISISSLQTSAQLVKVGVASAPVREPCGRVHYVAKRHCICGLQRQRVRIRVECAGHVVSQRDTKVDVRFGPLWRYRECAAK